MGGGGADPIAPFGRGQAAPLEDDLEALLQAVGAAVGNARHHRAAGEQLGVRRQHHRGHRAAGGEAGDEDPLPVDAVLGDQAVDHLPDRLRLAAVAGEVLRRGTS